MKSEVECRHRDLTTEAQRFSSKSTTGDDDH